MSGECDDCGWHTLECICSPGCPCKQSAHNTHLNAVRKFVNPSKPLFEGTDPPDDLPPVKWVNVRGRAEHEAVIKDKALCKELGLDQIFETIKYLKRWGSWLDEQDA